MARTYWLTGLSGAGKTTIALALKKRIPNLVHLDGDILRQGLCSDLGFTHIDRKENIRRAMEVAKLFNRNNLDVICAFITPTNEIRDMIYESLDAYLIYVHCPLSVCIDRDPKGLYQKALAGEITNFTGISSIFEIPNHSDLIVNTHEQTVEECVECIIETLM